MTWMLAAALSSLASKMREAVVTWTDCQEKLSVLVEDLAQVKSDENREKRELYEQLGVILTWVTEASINDYDKRL